jgi:pyruvate kinase
MQAMVTAGVDVARINCSHGNPTTNARAIADLRRVADECDQLLAIMVDLQGPKLRIGSMPKGGIVLRDGDIVVLADSDYSEGVVPLRYPHVLAQLRAGQRVLLDDGRLEFLVESAKAGMINCRVITGGRLTSNKGVHLPRVELESPGLTEKDREDVRFAVDQKVDYLALSFVTSEGEVELLRDFVSELGADIPIVAKIERSEALEAFDRILAAADGIMVARGDLGLDTPTEEVPFHQKQIISSSNVAGKPVITATQMLQSMISQPTPTRAEASDVANAILDGTDAAMLSGETAVGKYPVRAVKMMARICTNAEAHLPASRIHHVNDSKSLLNVTEAISQATVEIAAEIGATAILTATMSGTTARMVARHRPRVPIVAITPNSSTLMKLAMVWGVIPILVSRFSTTDEMVELMIDAALEAGTVSTGDRVVLTAGVPFGGEGLTNMLKVHIVGQSE